MSQNEQRTAVVTVYATKAETGKVVLTWNYAAVHAYGILRKIEDPALILGP